MTVVRRESLDHLFEPYHDYRNELELTYNEWMIGCKGKLVDNDELITYHISHGAQPGTAIVFKQIEENLYSPYAGIEDVFLIW